MAVTLIKNRTMARRENNSQFILEFYKAINGNQKTRNSLSYFITDQKLTTHLLFLEQLFPKFRLIPEEITTEQDRVIVRAKLIGKHTGEVEGIAPTHKNVNTVFATGYRIEKNKIVDHWFITDQIELIKQLGLATLLDEILQHNPDF